MIIKDQGNNVKKFKELNLLDKYSQEVFLLNVILEVILEQVSDEFLSEFNISDKNNLTIYELAKFVSLSKKIKNNLGMEGWIFEKAVYNSILVNESQICDHLNYIMTNLQKADLNSGGKDIDVIYWGTEKGKWINDPVKNLTLNLIQENDVIYINNNYYKFKEVFSQISTNTYSDLKELNFGNIWKSDFFIKQSFGNIWHGVDIKINKKDLKANACSIKITVFNNSAFNSPSYEYHPVLNQNIFVFPYFGDFGEKLKELYRGFISFLVEIASSKRGQLNYNMIHSNAFIFKQLYQYRGEKVLTIMYQLDEILRNNNYPIPERVLNSHSNMLIMNKLSIPENGIIQLNTSVFEPKILQINNINFNTSNFMNDPHIEIVRINNHEVVTQKVTHKNSPVSTNLRTELIITNDTTFENKILL